MSINDLTPAEYAKVRVLDIRIHAAEQKILARPVPEGTGNAVLLHTVEELDRSLTPHMRGKLLTANDRKMFHLLAKAEPGDLARIDDLVAERNTIISGARSRGREAREAVEAQRELERVRSELCDKCFTLHRGECA
jgi:hypothetical protein